MTDNPKFDLVNAKLTAEALLGPDFPAYWQALGCGINFQPQILIQCSSAGEEQEYIDISAAPEAADSLPQQGNGNSLPGSGGRR
jgi:hypothetical protein